MPNILQLDPNTSFKTVSDKIISQLPLQYFKNKKIFIKPNWVSHLHPSTGVTVDPQFIRDLAISIRHIGAADVVIGEASIVDTSLSFSKLKVKEIIGDNANIVDLSMEEKWVNVPVDSSLARHLRIPEKIFEYDTLLSVAKLKTHCQTRVSFTIKNLFGLLSKSSRQAAHKTDLHSCIAGLYLHLKERMNIIGILDGSVSLNGANGPLKGTAEKLDIIISGDNAIDVDMTGCLLIGCPINTVEHLKIVENTSKLTFDKSNIKGYYGSYPLKQFDLPPVGGWRGPVNLSPLIAYIFRKKPVWKYPDKCTMCGDCIRICPAKCIRNSDGNIVINRDMCIECLCCAEACSYGAMSYSVRFGWLHGMLKYAARKVKR